MSITIMTRVGNTPVGWDKVINILNSMHGVMYGSIAYIDWLDCCKESLKEYNATLHTKGVDSWSPKITFETQADELVFKLRFGI